MQTLRGGHKSCAPLDGLIIELVLEKLPPIAKSSQAVKHGTLAATAQCSCELTVRQQSELTVIDHEKVQRRETGGRCCDRGRPSCRRDEPRRPPARGGVDPSAVECQRADAEGDRRGSQHCGGSAGASRPVSHATVLVSGVRVSGCQRRHAHVCHRERRRRLDRPPCACGGGQRRVYRLLHQAP